MLFESEYIFSILQINISGTPSFPMERCIIKSIIKLIYLLY